MTPIPGLLGLPTFIPLFAVTIPVESTFVTSSYVKVPPIETFSKVAMPATTLELKIS